MRNRDVPKGGDGGKGAGKGDLLRPRDLKRALKGSLFGENILYLETLDSTNRLVKARAVEGAPEGTVVIAEEQSAGRGRLGRTWLSSGRENLLFSLVLRPPLPPERAFVLTMILALAASEGVWEASGVRTGIKWPNDLYVGEKKLAGVLTEFSVKKGVIDFVVVGMGLNVHWKPDGASDVPYPVTSLFAETGVRTNRGNLLAGVLRRFEGYYGQVKSGDLEGLYRRWNARSLILGKEVVIETGGEKIFGRALRIDPKGALVIRDPGGREQEILAGDVSLRLRDHEP